MGATFLKPDNHVFDDKYLEEYKAFYSLLSPNKSWSTAHLGCKKVIAEEVIVLFGGPKHEYLATYAIHYSVFGFVSRPGCRMRWQNIQQVFCLQSVVSLKDDTLSPTGNQRLSDRWKAAVVPMSSGERNLFRLRSFERQGIPR